MRPQLQTLYCRLVRSECEWSITVASMAFERTAFWGWLIQRECDRSIQRAARRNK